MGGKQIVVKVAKNKNPTKGVQGLKHIAIKKAIKK